MPHFHLSVQSGDNLILKRMKRRHAREHTLRFCETVRRLRPDVAFGADLIAGFPTETEAMFREQSGPGGCGGAVLPACIPVQRTGKHTCGQNAAASSFNREEPCTALAREGSHGRAPDWQHLAWGPNRELLVERPGLGRTRCFACVSFAEDLTPRSLVRTRIIASDGRILTARVLGSRQHLGVRAIA